MFEVCAARRFERSDLQFALLLLSAIAVLWRFTSEAWLGEDAYITFRTIDNFVNGYGLRWNVDERVQSYTHPLWLFVNTVPYAITREVPYTITSVSLLMAAGSYLVLGRRLMTSPLLLLLLVFVPVMASKSIALYATSGFETSLSFALVAVFVLLLIPGPAGAPTRWGWLALCGSLLMSNRLDHVVLVAPALAYLCVAEREDIRWRSFVMGGIPIAAWLSFSLFYYGFVFPNTARAKIIEEIPRADYIREGLLYGANLARWDLVALPILVLALLTTVGALVYWVRGGRDPLAGRLAAFGAGIFAYAMYVIYVGGDYHSGRLWSVPLFASVAMIAIAANRIWGELPTQDRWNSRRVSGALSVVVVLAVASYALGQWAPRPPATRGGISTRGLAYLLLGEDLRWKWIGRARSWSDAGVRLREAGTKQQEKRPINRQNIGFQGYAAGPEVKIVDVYALTDPLLALLPLDESTEWRIGHLRRIFPRGYSWGRQNDSLEKMDPAIAEYYQHLRLIVAGPLFDWKRLSTIFWFHSGRYDPLLDEWLERRRARLLSERESTSKER